MTHCQVWLGTHDSVPIIDVCQVTEMAVSELPGNPSAVWTVKKNSSGEHLEELSHRIIWPWMALVILWYWYVFLLMRGLTRTVEPQSYELCSYPNPNHNINIRYKYSLILYKYLLCNINNKYSVCITTNKKKRLPLCQSLTFSINCNTCHSFRCAR